MSSKRGVWVERMESWQLSGVSVAAFCRAENLSRAQFVYWQRALGAVKVASAKRPMLVPVRVDTVPVSALELALPNGLRLRVPPGFPSHEVVSLVRGLCA